jgi:hypothetical protein
MSGKVTAARPVWNVFVFTFIPVWIHAGLKPLVGLVQQAEWIETGLHYFRPSVMFNIYYKQYYDRNEMVSVWLRSCLML